MTTRLKVNRLKKKFPKNTVNRLVPMKFFFLNHHGSSPVFRRTILSTVQLQPFKLASRVDHNVLCMDFFRFDPGPRAHVPHAQRHGIPTDYYGLVRMSLWRRRSVVIVAAKRRTRASMSANNVGVLLRCY